MDILNVVDKIYTATINFVQGFNGEKVVFNLNVKRTNLEKFYEKPTKYAAFGLSDHVPIVVKPRARIQNKPVKLTTKSRDMTPNKQYAITSYLEH